MLVARMVRCPDCGSIAQRTFQLGAYPNETKLPPSKKYGVMARTECPTCDYLLEICMTTGQVMDSHVPSVVQVRSSYSVPTLTQVSSSVAISR